MVANEKDIPLVSTFVFKRVNALRSGFNDVCGLPVKVESLNNRSFRMIKGDLTLNFEEDGFKELSNFLIKDLQRSKPRYVENICCNEGLTFDHMKVLAIKNGFSHMEYSGIPGNLHGINIPYGNNSIRAFLNNSSTGHDYIEFYVYFLKEGIDSKYRITAFNWALLFFLLAISIQVVEFICLDHKS